MNSDLDRLETLHRDLAVLLDSAPEPVRARLSSLATELVACTALAAQAQRVHEGHLARISVLASEFSAIATLRPAAPVPASGSSPSAAPPTMAPTMAPTSAQPPVRTGTPSPASAPPAPRPEPASGARRILAEDVWLVSRSTVSPTCDAFVFEIRDTTGGVQDLRLEAYRLAGKTFVKTRSPLAGATPGWMAGEDGYGAFFLCHHDRIATIADEKLRTAAGFALG